MILGHIGFSALIFGVLVVNTFEIEKDLALRIGDKIKLDKFEIVFEDIKKIKIWKKK